MLIEEICDRLIVALENAGYEESTIFQYRGVIRRFKEFCEKEGVAEYNQVIGQKYADDVISAVTGKFSKQRYFSQGRFIRLLNTFDENGRFDFATMKRGKRVPNNPSALSSYEKYCAFLAETYDNENTIHFYEYGMYYLLQYLDQHGYEDINSLTSSIAIQYITDCKQERQREVLCELRSIFRFLNREDLLEAIAGIHAPRIKRIVPVLTEEECKRIDNVIANGEVSMRDAAIIRLGLSCGIRACDLINLKISDIDWVNETISFKQSKTGNLVCLPLTIAVGNTIARYLCEERPPAKNDYLFVRQLAPFDAFKDHASCYAVVERVFAKAGISKEGRIFGMRMLRHNAASTMVKYQVPIETIAAILGHSSPDTTDIYITTDETRLLECVLPMDGISKEVNP